MQLEELICNEPELGAELEPENESDNEPESRPSVDLQIIIVEDDTFQQSAVSNLVEQVVKSIEGRMVVPEITVAGTASSALALAQQQVAQEASKPRAARLVLLDYLLPAGFNGDELLQPLRASLGQDASIVMVSSPAREWSLTQCVDRGADTYRLKPLSPTDIKNLITFAVQKFDFLETSRRSRARSPLCAGFTVRVLDGIEHLLAHGRRTPTYIAESGGTAVAIKTMSAVSLRGPPPPEHPHLNRVLQRLHEEANGGKCYEVRELADGGEFFDILVENEQGCQPADVLKWMVMLCDAVAHCHMAGAVHGQLLPENVLLHQGRLQLSGFYCCGADGAQVPLRTPFTSLYAPELRGQESADAATLAAADIWSLGQLLVLLLTGVRDDLLASAREAIVIGNVAAAVSAMVVSSAAPARAAGCGSGSGSGSGSASVRGDGVDTAVVGGSEGGGSADGVEDGAPIAHPECGPPQLPPWGSGDGGTHGTSTQGVSTDSSPGASTHNSSSTSLAATPSPLAVCGATQAGVKTERAAHGWNQRVGRSHGRSSPKVVVPPRNREELARSALKTLADLLLQHDPTLRPTASDILTDLSSIQLILS